MERYDGDGRIAARRRHFLPIIGLSAIALAVCLSPQPAPSIGASVPRPRLAISIDSGVVRLGITINVSTNEEIMDERGND